MLSQPELKLIQDRLRWLFCSMVHVANHLRCGTDGLKVGGHQPRCAPMATQATVFSCNALRPQDGVAVKSHAGPSLHAPQCLAGNQTLEEIRNFRGFGGIQGCPSRNKDSANVDCLTGSIGLGVAINAFASLVQDYVRVRGRIDSPEGRVVASSRPGAVHGHREADLGVEHFGKAEDVSDPWRHFGIDRNSILRAIESLFPGRSLRAVGGLG
ncbi:MAG: hypothetical protein OXJ64_05725 [Boseongicola sp.]|nr:hypothetical protein [Boseongicola sp.]